MEKRFLNLIPWLLKWEGRTYENDPDDNGGATKFGIDQRSHPDEDIRNLTEKRAIEIYWRYYWVANGCTGLPSPFAEVYFNCCVNCGPGRAKKIRNLSGEDADDFLVEQEAFYHRLAHARPASRKYLRGWLNRTRDLRKHLRIPSK